MSNITTPSSSGETADVEARLAKWAEHPKLDEFRIRACHDIQLAHDEHLEVDREVIICSLSKAPLYAVKVETKKHGEAEQVLAWLQEHDDQDTAAGRTVVRAPPAAASNSGTAMLGSHPPSPEVEHQASAAVIGYASVSRPTRQNDEDSDEACATGDEYEPLPWSVDDHDANLPKAILAGVATSADSKLRAKKARWTVLPTPNNGGEGSGNAGRRDPDKKRLKFSFKNKGGDVGKRVKPPLPKAMAKAAAIADAQQERLIVAAAAASKAAAAASEASAAVAFEGPASQTTDAYSKPTAETGAPRPEAADMTAGRSRVGGSSTRRPATTPASAVVSNLVRRVKLSCSTPLLAENGKTCGKKLQGALYNNTRLFGMRWDGGLVFVNVAITDAVGGGRLPTVNLTQSPTALIIEALGVKVRIGAPSEAKNKEGFIAACEGVGVSSVSTLRDQLVRLDQFIAQEAAGGQESLMRVDNLSEMRLILRQVGVIREEEFCYLRALGGIWLGIYYNPPVGKAKSVWNTGGLTPTIKFFVLMRRARLADQGGLTVEENPEYAASASASAAAAAAAAAPAVEWTEEEEEADRLYRYALRHPREYLDAVKEQMRTEKQTR